MEKSTYILFFYSIVIGLTATSYLKGWGELIANRHKCKNWLVSIVWSVSFFFAIINEWFIQYSLWGTRTDILDLIKLLVFPFGIYVISELLFPKINSAECDYFQHFLKHYKVVCGIFVVLLLWKFDFTKPLNESFRTRTEIMVLMVPCLIPFISSKRYILLLCGVLFISFGIYRIILMSI